MPLTEGAGPGNSDVARRNWTSDYQSVESPMSPRPGPQPFRQETQSFFFSSLLKYSCFCLFVFSLCHTACGISVSRPGIEPGVGS